MIQKLFVGICLWGAAIAVGHAQQKEIEVSAPVSGVKLHINGATVEHTTSLMVSPGRNHFVFTELTSKLYPQTIQFTMRDSSVKVVSVTSKVNFLRKSLEDKRITVLRDSADIVRKRIADLEDEHKAYLAELDVMNQVRNFKGTDKTLTMAELKSMVDFYRSRTMEVQKLMTDNRDRYHTLGRRLFDLKLQLHEWNAGQLPTSEIVLVIESPAAARVDMKFRYVVSDAGWAAIYDLESNGANRPIELRYRAQAYNNTGVDWNQVQLTLSTADPMETAIQPSLKIWNLDQYSSQQIHTITLNRNNLNINYDLNDNNWQKSLPEYNRIVLNSETHLVQVKEIMGNDFRSGVDYETEYYRRYQAEKVNRPQEVDARIEVPEFNIDFPIKNPFTIPSDAKPYSIDIAAYNLNVTYKYFAVPKMDREAFLLAQVVGWEDLDLVGGPVNIFHGPDYIGQSYLNIRQLSDTLAVSMGRDDNVVVTRLKVAGKSKRQIFGGMNKVSVAYNISTRNNHTYPIDVEIQDQIPITSDKDVQITLDDAGGGELEPKVGTLKWRFRLQPGETRTFEFAFSIKFPEGKTVEIQYKESKEMMQRRSF